MRTRGDIEEEIQEILENQGILLQEIDWNQENREWENYARFVQEIQEFQENYARLVQEILDNAARSVQETQEILMRFITSIMVWVSLLATLGLLGLAAAYSWVKYSAFRDGEVTVTAPGDGDSVTNTFDAYLQLKDTWLALFIISTIFLVVIALITLFLRKRLLLAIALINEASKVWKLNAVTHTSESPGCGQHPQQLVLPPGLVPAAGGGDGLVRADRHLPRLLRDAAAQLGQQE